MGSIVQKRTSKGDIRYVAYVRRKGHPSRTKTFSSRTKARSWIRRVEAAIEERRDLPMREAMRRSIADEVKLYLEGEGFARLSPAEQVKRAKQLERWVELLGDIKVAELSPLVIRDASTRLRKRGSRERAISSATANRYLAALSKFCSYLVSVGLLAENPARAVTVERGPERRRDRVLALDERRRLLEAARREDHVLYALIILGLTTGGRQGEILRLKWSDVGLAQKRVRFLRTKNSEPRSVPLPDAAVEVLEDLRKVRQLDGSVFGGVSFPRQAWRRALRLAEIDDLRYHDLRHCYATALAEAGASLSELKAALGHKTLSQVVRYQHIAERHLEDSIRERLASVDLV